MIDVIDQKQMYNNVITGRENTSKEWNCITYISFLRCFRDPNRVPNIFLKKP